MQKRFYNFSIIIVFLLLFIAGACDSKPKEYYKVSEVHDGDTVTIVTSSFLVFFETTEKVRLIGIDSPELAQEPWGRRAKNHLRKLIKESDWMVKIELDVQHRDKYGRLLAYLWTKDGQMINYLMLRNGYAMVYTIPPNVKYAEWFLEAQRLARQERKGFWSEGGLSEVPSEWRKKNPRR